MQLTTFILIMAFVSQAALTSRTHLVEGWCFVLIRLNNEPCVDSEGSGLPT